MVDLNAPVLVTFVVYLIAMIGIGLWVYRRTVTLSDFALGGRDLNAPTAALSAQASDMSGWLLLGLPGAVYAAGIGATWIAVGLAVGTYLNWLIVAPRLRTYTARANNSISLSAYFEERFEDRTRSIRVVSAIVIIVFFTVYVSSGLVAGGVLFESTFGVPYTTAVTVATLVIVVYAFLGGFLAVSLTDAVQGTLMFLALLVLPLLGIGVLGGFDVLTGQVQAASPDLWTLGTEATYDAEAGTWGAPEAVGAIGIVSLLAWGLGYFGQPHIVARFMGIRSATMVPTARRIGTTWVVVTLAGATLVGLVGIGLLDQPLDDPETVFLALIQELLNPWVGGVLLAAVLAAIMSTADSQLIVSSTALTEDFYRAFLNRDASGMTLVWVGRATVIAVAIVAYIIALPGETAILDIVAFAWAGFGAAFGPVIILSLFWSRMTGAGAMAGIVAGAATVLVWEQVPALVDTGVYSMLPGWAAALIAAFVGGRFFGKVPERAWVGDYADEEAEAAPQA
ncbi:sodium/proline symporter PutP [Egibacter rhizosphaerae]|uniref:Sodium/proline symporter n=1 Tax=Egibacter rhizosphaerae TaxID=1670831 RepID=A0A411YIF5_9ACTN|nr:sodium/proline symporter PutP [Egibacter rhizosphaerae]QBI20977.1 sodium/proline symporter PutP [Egibacter rhizosphaerae]